MSELKELLIKLSELDCIAGDEGEITAFIKKEIEPYADSVETDAVGNIIAFKKGAKRRVRPLMVTAHIDEVGFYITGINESGTLKLGMTGGIDPRVLIGAKLRCGKKKVPGIISLKAIHLVSREEEKVAPALRQLYVDIGASSREQAQGMVAVGEPVYFDTPAHEVGDCLLAKAIDDRIGCAIMIECLKKPLEYDTWFVFNSGEEIGCRGSIVAAKRILPGIMVAIEGSPAADIEDVPEHKVSCLMRHGVALPLLDRGTVYDRDLRETIGKKATEAGIAWQYCFTVAGSTDASSASGAGTGALAIGVEVPTRYLHAPAGLVYPPDMEAGLAMTELIIKEVGECNV